MVKKIMNKLLTTILLLSSLVTLGKTVDVDNILSININSTINTSTSNFIKQSLKHAEANNYKMLLIKLNTPGGFVTSTKEILTIFGESNIPIMVWITPQGASATSAGAIIASSAHILVMNKGTNIGAATPIKLSGDIKQKDIRAKSINDLVALISGLSTARGRNSKKFAEMITKGSSFTFKEAKKLSLIDGIVENQENLKSLINNRIVNIKGIKYKLIVNNIKIDSLKMSMGQSLLDIIANPSLAYILFLIGAALLYFELQSPGGLIAGAIGIISLILAAIAFQLLPLNIGALILIIIAFLLFVMEAYIISYGILTLGGVFSLIVGSLFLFKTDDSYLKQIPPEIMYSVIASICSFVTIIGFFFYKTRKKDKKDSLLNLIDKEGKIVKVIEKYDSKFYYQIKVVGEIWKCESSHQYKIGDKAKIVEQDNKRMLLKI